MDISLSVFSTGYSCLSSICRTQMNGSLLPHANSHTTNTVQDRLDTLLLRSCHNDIDVKEQIDT